MTQEQFSAQERAAMKERAAELRRAGRRSSKEDKAAAQRQEMLDRIQAMPQPDRAMALRVHEIVGEVAPELAPKLWYGQPAWARDGRPVVFFRSGQMDKSRYSTLGFGEDAALDSADGIWPTAYALSEVTPAAEGLIRELVTRVAVAERRSRGR